MNDSTLQAIREGQCPVGHGPLEKAGLDRDYRWCHVCAAGWSVSGRIITKHAHRLGFPPEASGSLTDELTSTDQLTQRITDALDRAGKLASEATPGPWHPEQCGDYGQRTWLIPGVLRERYGDNALSFGEDERVANFVASWYPNRVLMLIAAERRVLARHKTVSIDGISACLNCWPTARPNCAELLALAARWGVTP
jgi:hypothetical protein